MANQFGYACPKCGSANSIDIEANVWVRLTNNGTDADSSRDGSHTWDDISPATCECGWEGVVRDLDGGEG